MSNLPKVEVIKPDKELLELIKEIIGQNTMIIRALANPMMIAKDMLKEEK